MDGEVGRAGAPSTIIRNSLRNKQLRSLLSLLACLLTYLYNNLLLA